jgi:hypothetical protein
MVPPRLRNIGAAALSTGAVLSAVLLSGCAAHSPAPAAPAAQGSAPASAPVAASSSSALPATSSPRKSRLPSPPGPEGPGLRCTNQYDYSGDVRNNADINSIGSDTRTCPPVQRTSAPAGEPRLPSPPGPADPGSRCTNQYDYSGDVRNNADINSIGSDTKTCPPVQRS